MATAGKGLWVDDSPLLSGVAYAKAQKLYKLKIVITNMLSRISQEY